VSLQLLVSICLDSVCLVTLSTLLHVWKPLDKVNAYAQHVQLCTPISTMKCKLIFANEWTMSYSKKVLLSFIKQAMYTIGRNAVFYKCVQTRNCLFVDAHECTRIILLLKLDPR